jgi:hypothetical protein
MCKASHHIFFCKSAPANITNIDSEELKAKIETIVQKIAKAILVLEEQRTELKAIKNEINWCGRLDSPR